MVSAELARCLGPDAASKRPWLRQRATPRVITQADPAAWSDLFRFDLLDDLLHGTALRRPYFHVTKQGRRSPPSLVTREVRVLNAAITGVPHPEHIYRELAGGATLVLLQLEDILPAVRGFCAGIAAELGRPVDCGGYVTPPRAPGLPLHKDAQDVILLQISGSKSWSVHEQVDDGRPVGRRLRPEERPPRLLEAVLQPGDALVIPSGCPHAAVSADTVSCHLTIGITPPSRRDGIGRLVSSAVGQLDGLDATLDDTSSVAAERLRHDVRRLTEELDAAAAATDDDLLPHEQSPLRVQHRLRDLQRLLQGAGTWIADSVSGDELPPGCPELAAAVSSRRCFRPSELTDGVPAEWTRALTTLVLDGRLEPA